MTLAVDRHSRRPRATRTCLKPCGRTQAVAFEIGNGPELDGVRGVMVEPDDDERDPTTGRWLTWRGQRLPLPRTEWPEDSPDFDAFSWYLNRQHPAEVAAGWVKARPARPRCGCASWAKHWMGDQLCTVPDEDLYPEDWNGGRFLPVTLCGCGRVTPQEGGLLEARGQMDDPDGSSTMVSQRPNL
jgi:hypothetical protein